MAPQTVIRSLLDHEQWTVNISVRKSLIKDKIGRDQFPYELNCLAFGAQDILKNNFKIEDEKVELNKVISNLSSKLENSKIDTENENLILVSKLSDKESS